MHTRATKSGYALFEIVLALMIFSIAVLGLVKALNAAIDLSSAYRRETEVLRLIQSQIDEYALLTLEEIALLEPAQIHDVFLTTEIEALEFQNEGGQVLEDLYTLRITATWMNGNDEETLTGERYVYKPE